MFIDYDFDSVNKMLPPGSYGGSVHAYGNARTRISAVLYRYTRVGSSKECACDLIVRDAAGDLYVRDFVLQEDGRWRDSDGNVAGDLSALMPEEILDLPLRVQTDLPVVEVTA